MFLFTVDFIECGSLADGAVDCELVDGKCEVGEKWEYHHHPSIDTINDFFVKEASSV